MTLQRILRPFKVAGAAAILGSLVLTSASFAQTMDGGPVLRIDSPDNRSIKAGNITFTGLAYDPATNEAASRVAVFDGSPTEARYVADVSMDTTRNLSAAVPGRAGSGQIGWTLILDSRRLADGGHDLTFQAHFPSGVTTSTSFVLGVDNRGAYDYYGYQGYSSYPYGSLVPLNGGYPVYDPWYGPNTSGVYYDQASYGYWVNGTWIAPSHNGMYYDAAHGGYMWNGSWWGPSVNGISYDPSYNGYWVNGTWVGTPYYNGYPNSTNYLSAVYYNGGYWVNGTWVGTSYAGPYYNTQTGQNCTGWPYSQCAFTTTKG